MYSNRKIFTYRVLVDLARSLTQVLPLPTKSIQVIRGTDVRQPEVNFQTILCLWRAHDFIGTGTDPVQIGLKFYR
jgi:hypothetical protein